MIDKQVESEGIELFSGAEGQEWCSYAEYLE